ncbi:VUT family protein [Candidatus Tisiphia endosymbiont of Beris chalybata]|uniref:VUT family protein n=1 Tax=Candidatus Tisiphia endosymbiont of Beris chalybata TaxID=3066262 RepID=UPI00312CC03E
MSNINNKVLALLMSLLFTFTYLLNFFNKIAECSLVFVFLALTANIITELHTKKSAIISLIVSIVVSFGLLWNFDYYIHGRIIPMMTGASFLSLLVSIYCSTSVLQYLKPTYSFNLRNFIGLVVGAIIDGSIMIGFLINQFSSSRVIAIFWAEVSFKCLYSLVIYGLLFFGSYVINSEKRSNNSIGN